MLDFNNLVKVTYCLITSFTNLLAHQLVDPLGLITEGGVDSWNNEWHIGWFKVINILK